MESMENSAYSENTIVVFWVGFVHVPLIIKVPGLVEKGSGNALTVNLLALYPTLFELTGIPMNPKNDGVGSDIHIKEPNSRSKPYNSDHT